MIKRVLFALSVLLAASAPAFAQLGGSSGNNADAVAAVATGLGQQQSYMYLFNGVTFDRWPGTAVGGARVNMPASATGGGTPGHALSAATNNSTNVKASAGTLYSITIVNTTTTFADFRLYDTASAPTCSSATGAVENIPIQSNAVSPGIHLNFGPAGMAFTTGIGYCLTGANADNDNTNSVTGININYVFK